MNIILFTCGCTEIDAYHFALGSIYQDLSKSILKTNFYFIFEGFSYEVTLDKFKFTKSEITYTIRKK
jgi:hypothetical protein